jgi:hypothetical protein
MAVTVAFQKREWSLETRVKIKNFRHSQLPNTHQLLFYTQREGTLANVYKRLWGIKSLRSVIYDANATYRWNFVLF